MKDFRDLTPQEQHEMLEQIKQAKYPMGEAQPAQIDCRITNCIYNMGAGLCYNVAPAITLNPNNINPGVGSAVCWSQKTPINSSNPITNKEIKP